MQNLISNFHIIGCGGVGTKLLRDTLLSRQFKIKNLMLWDSDIVEEKNLVRQLFSKEDVGDSKSRVLESKLHDSPEYSCVEHGEGFLENTFALGDFNISSSLAMGLNRRTWADGTIIIMATDNIESRLLALELIDEWGMDDSLVISAANATSDDGAGIGSTAWVYKNEWSDTDKDPRVRHDLASEEKQINMGRPCSEDDSTQTNIANSGASQRAIELLTFWTHPKYSKDKHISKHLPIEHSLFWQQTAL